MKHYRRKLIKKSIFKIAAISLMIVFVLCSCSRKGEDSNGDNNAPTGIENKNIRKENTNGGIDASDRKFSSELYDSLLVSYLSTIEECRSCYSENVKCLKSNADKYSFANCTFDEFPEFTDIKVLSFGRNNIGVNEAVDIISKQIEKDGFKDSIDIEKELRDFNSFVPGTGKEYPYDRLSGVDNFDNFENGNSFMVTSMDYHILMQSFGILSYSNGIISRKADSGLPAEADSVGLNSHEIVVEGRPDNLKETIVSLSDGSAKVEDMVSVAKKYFLAGTPYAPNDHVEIDIPYISIFKLKDIQGIGFILRRTYDNIPFAWDGYGNISYSDLKIDPDRKQAYTIEKNNIDAYHGYNDNQLIDEVYSGQNCMLTLSDAFDELKTKMASELSVEFREVELEYVPVIISEPTEDDLFTYEVIYPCWAFKGDDRISGRKINFFVDVLTGDTYYYLGNSLEE